MFLRMIGALGCVTLLAGCPGVPPVNTATISASPASERSMARARQAVAACALLPDADAFFAELTRLGYARQRLEINLANGGIASVEMVRSLTSDVRIEASARGCTIGVVDMTPEQSLSLAQPWVRAFYASSNASLGQGLSPHAVGAWRRVDDAREIYIAAYRTWPTQGAMANTTEQGAAVELRYRTR